MWIRIFTFHCSLQQGHALKEKLFCSKNGDIHRSLDRTFSGEGFSNICGSLTECDTARQLSQQSQLSGELLGELEEIKAIRSELLSVKRERRELQQQSRELMKTVQVKERGGEGGRVRENSVSPCCTTPSLIFFTSDARRSG